MSLEDWKELALSIVIACLAVLIAYGLGLPIGELLA